MNSKKKKGKKLILDSPSEGTPIGASLGVDDSLPEQSVNKRSSILIRTQVSLIRGDMRG